MRGNHTGEHPYPQGYSQPIGPGQSSTGQSQIKPVHPATIILKLITALIFGALAGWVGMVFHAARWEDSAFPWGIVLATVVLVVIVAQSWHLGAVNHPRFAGWTLIAAWVGACLVNMWGYFSATQDRFFLPVPLDVDFWATPTIALDRSWQLILLLSGPLVAFIMLRRMRKRKGLN